MLAIMELACRCIAAICDGSIDAACFCMAAIWSCGVEKKREKEHMCTKSDEKDENGMVNADTG